MDPAADRDVEQCHVGHRVSREDDRCDAVGQARRQDGSILNLSVRDDENRSSAPYGCLQRVPQARRSVARGKCIEWRDSRTESQDRSCLTSVPGEGPSGVQRSLPLSACRPHAEGGIKQHHRGAAGNSTQATRVEEGEEKRSQRHRAERRQAGALNAESFAPQVHGARQHRNEQRREYYSDHGVDWPWMNRVAYGQSEVSDKVNGSRQMIVRMCNAGVSALLLPSDPLRRCRRGFG